MLLLSIQSDGYSLGSWVAIGLIVNLTVACTSVPTSTRSGKNFEVSICSKLGHPNTNHSYPTLELEHMHRRLCMLYNLSKVLRHSENMRKEDSTVSIFT